MAQTCDTSSVCAEITAALAALPAPAEAAVAAASVQARRLMDIVSRYPGAWIGTEAGDLPSLSELVNRLTALGVGLADWFFFEYEPSAARTVITLPGAPSAALIYLNGVLLPAGDYSLVGDTLTPDDPLDLYDLLTVRGYG